MSAEYEWAYYAEIGERIRVAREAVGMSRRQVADKLGVTPVAVHYWETGASRMKLWTYERLRRLLGGAL